MFKNEKDFLSVKLLKTLPTVLILAFLLQNILNRLIETLVSMNSEKYVTMMSFMTTPEINLNLVWLLIVVHMHCFIMDERLYPSLLCLWMRWKLCSLNKIVSYFMIDSEVKSSLLKSPFLSNLFPFTACCTKYSMKFYIDSPSICVNTVCIT